MSISMKQALEDRTNRPDDLVASSRQVEMVFKRGEKALTLRAQKLWHLLVKKAGVELGDDKVHSMPLSDLREVGHMPLEARIAAVQELQSTLVEVATTLEDGKPYIVSGGLLAFVARAIDENGLLKWKFSEALRIVFANSDHWAILSKRAVMAFESRYSLRLYEIIALRTNLDHKTSEIFDLEILRDRFGVPIGKMAKWFDFRRFVLEPATAEVNQLAGFSVSYEAIKRGRSVVAIKLLWGEKPARDRAATKRELDGSKVGRKARRKGTVETLVEPQQAITPLLEFPPTGSISFGRWGKLARQHAPMPTPDVDIIASAFRKWSQEKNIPFDSKGIEKAFIGFCKGFKTN